MRSRNTTGWMRSDPVLELARRGAVRLVVGGAVVLSLASLVQVIVGESGGIITLTAALATGVVGFVMGRQERPNVVALLALVAASAIAAEVFAALDGQSH